MIRCCVTMALLVTLAAAALSADTIDMALDAKVIVDVPDTVNKGDTFQVTVRVQSIDDLAGFQFDVRYTPGVVDSSALKSIPACSGVAG
jgi:hypothetical protein